MFKPELAVSVSCVKSLGLKDGIYRYALREDYEKRLIELKEQGISRVELEVSAGYAWDFEKYVILACKLAKKHKMKINSVHFPFGFSWIDLTCKWEKDRLAIIEWLGKVFKKLDKFNIKAYVFHPTPFGNFNREKNSEYMAKLCDTADKLAEKTTAYVCVENMVSKLMATLSECVDYINGAKKAQMIVDVNHFLQDNPATAILKLGDRVKTLHISDNDGIKERHILPGEGIIDFSAIISALEKVNYDGAFCYELYDGYTAKQIKENYDKLFEKA